MDPQTAAPRLIASDIDGTLLNYQDRVLDRVRDAVVRSVNAGTVFALATGRPHRWIFPVLDQLPIRPICVTANGAVLYDPDRDEVIKVHEISPATMAEVVELASEAFHDHGGVAIGCERGGKSAFEPEEEMFVVSPDFLNTWEEQGFGIVPTHEVIAQPAVKLILRSTVLNAPQMFELLYPLVDPAQAHVTYSMNDGLLEITAPGVNKGLGVASLADLHGIDQSEVLCFGDMPNDIEMLRWAGTGIAMGNAHEEVKEVADFITGTNNEGGVAQVLERWF